MAKEAKTTDKKADDKKAAEKKATPAKEIVTVKSAALSTGVGPAVLAGLDKSYKDEQKANELLQAVAGKRYDLLSQTTSAIVKAVKADPSIDLSAAFSGDAKKMNILNDQLGLALGFREVTETPPDAHGAIIKRIGYAKAVQKYFPTAKDDKNAPETKRKHTLRSNFLHLVKKCAQVANGIVVNDLEIKTDKSGTLLVSGPAVKKAFGQDSVVLNEKQTIGEGENAVKLTQKPSFTAVAKLGAEAVGKVLQPRAPSGTGTNATDPGKAVQAIAKSLADACAKLKLPADDDTKRALSIAQSAIDKVLAAK